MSNATFFMLYLRKQKNRGQNKPCEWHNFDTSTLEITNSGIRGQFLEEEKLR
jgi:hypothetical protein